MPQAKFLRRFVFVAIICALSLAAQYAGVFSSWNRSIGDTRMAWSPKASQGQFVFVSIDAQSLSKVGAWPWTRAIHATMLDSFLEGGVVDVLFDIDFTFSADVAGDRAFEKALEDAGGAVFLAAFAQPATAADSQTLHYNLPLAGFGERSWPALVNVGADSDGLVRDYPFGAQLGDTFVSSAGALFASRFGDVHPSFEIDFSIRPDSIPVISAIDVIDGNFPRDAFAGRSVIVGASAVELSDQLSVPVHGVISGPLIHALAAETLVRDLELRMLRPEIVVLALLGLFGLLQAGLQRSPWLSLALPGVGLIAVELGALALFRDGAIQVPSAMLYPSLIGFSFWRLARALDVGRWLVRVADAEASNTLGLLEQVFDDSSDGIVILGKDGSVIRSSASAAAIFGKNDEGLLDLPRKLSNLGKSNSAATLQTSDMPSRMVEISRGGTTKLLEYQATQSEVSLPTRLGQGTATQKITTLVVRDITRLKKQERHIAYLSNYDERTGALRRGAFLAFLDLRLEENRSTVLFAVTLRRFKTINVTLGRDIGDALLKEVVARLDATPFRLSAIARLDGTSFAFYTERTVESTEAHQLAEEILSDIAQPYRLPQANAHVGVRGGYTIIEGDSDVTAAMAIEQAEDAMGRAKELNIPLARFDCAAWKEQRRARDIERALEDALANEEFHLLYQPQHRVSDGALVGAEALIRWNSSKLGKVLPDEFIGIAESTGFIVELGKWTLERAAKDALILPDELMIAVNVSGFQIMHGDFAREVDSVLRKVGLSANRICLELTETVLLASTEAIIETMQDLSFSGLTWALDDFGTGFSSMEYLSKMPLDKIKLDKSFTMKLGDDPTARPILHSSSELCRGLGVSLLCEGVETVEQLRVLAEEGCTEAQGYFFGKPMPIDLLLSNSKAVKGRK